MIELIIASIVAISIPSSMFLKSKIRTADKTVALKKINSLTEHKTLLQFLNDDTNRLVTRQYYYEAALVILLFKLTILISIIVMVTLCVLIINYNVSQPISIISEWILKLICFGFVINAISTMGCYFIAGKIQPEE